MNKLEQVTQRLAEITDEQAALLDEADEQHDGELTEELEAQYTALETERKECEATRKRLEASAARREQVRERQAQQGQHPPTRRETATPPRVTRENAEDDPNRGFRNHVEFLETVRVAQTSGRVDERLRPLATAGSDEHGVYSDPSSGFLVPEGFMPTPLTLSPEDDPTSALVTPVPMETLVLKLNARVDKDHSSSVSGGLRFYRRTETQDVPSSTEKYEQVKLEASSLMGVSFATEELLSASPRSYAAILAAGFAEERGSQLLSERIDGTGAGEPEGILNADCLISVAKESGQSADTIVGANILKMRKRVWRYSRAIWLANHDAYDELAQVHIAGTNGDVFLFRPGNGEDVPDTLLGRPIYFTEYAKTLGDKGDLMCCVWSEYLFGTYHGPRMAESMHVRFLEHERTYKFYEMNDGRCWWRTALTPKNSTSTLSPFVTLNARA